MPEIKDDREIIRSKGGFVNDLTVRIKLIWRLIQDPRVSPLLKILPIGAVLYLFFPDLAPGPIDDAALLWLGGYLFVELCPPEVVEEHMRSLNAVIPGQWNDSEGSEEEIVDAEWEEK